MHTESVSSVHIHETIPLAADPLAAPATPAPAPVAVAEPAGPKHYRVTFVKNMPIIVVAAESKDEAWEAYAKIAGIISRGPHTPLVEQLDPATVPVTDLADLRDAYMSAAAERKIAYEPQHDIPQPAQRYGERPEAYAARLRDYNQPGTDQGYGRKFK